ncbi:hypothetical protein AUC44_11635 [Deinococcus actinosclerus]|uniref:Pilus assembly protein PilP n=2 Tax=Deinococcus actinosclerus TaxID=1768108 RepID=A0ABN4K6G2_9DEIO|nr:hypothetical protein AUC44_11635 [Deinococcus actinosclerus]
MKLVLGLLLLVAAIGLWYVLTNRGAAPATEVQTPTTPSETVPVTPTPPSGTTDAAPSSGVQSGGQVDVEVIPPFPTDATDPAQGAAAAVTDTPPTPSGINPAGTLASVPGNNPFRPLSVTADAQAAAGTPTPATQPQPGSASSTAPVASTPEVTPIASGGALGLTPVSGSAGTPASGAIPLPTIPSSGSTPPVVTPIGSGGTVVVTPGGASGSGTGTPVAITPVKPPVAGVNVPAVTSLPDTTAARPGGQAGTTPATTLPATTLPTAVTPQVISEIGSAETAAASPLDSFVQAQGLAFNAVVLGPVNTAIFRSKDGYVVVAVGQTLPDSQVTVKEVTATGATLSLGTDSKTLELDKR